MPRKLAAGNWKMNGHLASVEEIKALAAACPEPGCDVLICPPATAIASFVRAAAGTPIALGAQDCHISASGAHTGDLSAKILVDAGASYIIVGHSERRTDHGETDALIRAKAEAAWRAGATAIICVGETEAERDANAALDVVTGQIAGSTPDGANADNTVIAYEPVWAIGTGRVPSLEDIAEMHDAIRAALVARFGDDAKEMRLLYGGSVKPGNAAEIFGVSNVDGGLVGGASLKASDFAAIVQAAD